MSGMTPAERAGAIQREAARPDRSAAVRASAGSGKTRVLIDRFVRLCVEGEHNDVHPRSILAITFTRKAATEIRGRLLQRARKLALAPAADRRAMLAGLFAGRTDPGPRPREEDRAARLYERLLEDPSGLQVGTIHSFCQRILAHFATEAGLDPHAGLIEDREDLLDEALDRLVAETAVDPGLAACAESLGAGPSAARIQVRGVFGEQMRLDRWLCRAAAAQGLPPRPRAPLASALLDELRAALFGDAAVDDAVTTETMVPAILEAAGDLAGSGLDGVVSALDADESAKLSKPLEKLRSDLTAAPGAADVRRVLLTGQGALRKFSRIKDEAMKGRFQELVAAAAAPVLQALRRQDLVALYRRNRATLLLGLRALDLFDELKRRDRVLDFGDLEDMACQLMGDQARALSLLFRMEDSLRHVLVDEFQDTNFNQRDILMPFVEEFLAGGGGEGAVPPTVFFVGDMKQSIYGFRGAEPGIFAGMMDLLAQRGPWVHTLPTNFRSLPPMVDGVGSLFGSEPLVSRLPDGEEEDVHQLAGRSGDAGPVTVLAAYEDQDDGLSGDQSAAAAAAGIARSLMDDGATVLDDDGAPRPLLWSDIMVLYRSRTGVSLYEQAFRRAGIPIEPAGRGMLAASREVQDVLALLRWLVWPDDDVALATVLRSPVMRLDEKAFQELLAARGLQRTGPDGRLLPPAGLWTTLRRRGSEDPDLGGVVALLEAWRKDTGFVGIHELLRRIYREGDLPARFEAAGGPQARTNLERLYDLALSPEMATTPTVRRFIELVDKARRRGGHEEGTPGSGGEKGRVRFMTIHGAKGLEAPVVLLVDADRAPQDRGANLRLSPGHADTALVFGATRDLRRGVEGAGSALPPDALQGAAAVAADTAAREESNLLYVALTRACERLYVLGGMKTTNADEAPLRLLRTAAAAEGGGVSLDDPPDLQRPPLVVERDAAEAESVEPTVWTPPVLGQRQAKAAPSAAAHGSGSEAGSAGVAVRAAEHGTQVHLLLQLASERGAMPPGSGPAHDEARAVFEDSRLDWVFRPATVGGRGLAEAPIITRGADAGADPAPTAGIIDRLVVRPDRVDIVDYKSNRWGGDPERRQELVRQYQSQLSDYRSAVAALFPGRTVGTWLLLTDPGGRDDHESGLVEIAFPDPPATP